MTCGTCANPLDPNALSCTNCQNLVHATALESLAARASEAWRLGRFAEERALWIESLALLPEDTVQHRTIANRVAEINRALPGETEKSAGGWKKAAGFGPVALAALGKAKFLLLGLTKAGTLLTMLASLGVYWTLYGWPLALGLVLSIYVHEMGHVAMIRRYGFAASAPMFIPGFGAFIQLRSMNLPPVPDSRIGLAGPMYGLGVALVTLAAWRITGIQILGVIAHFTAWMNLFNLIPVWQLDGSRGLRSFTRAQRGLVLATAVVLWGLSRNPLLFLIAAVCGWRMFTKDWQAEPDNQGLLQFTGLLAMLTFVLMLSAGAARAGGGF